MDDRLTAIEDRLEGIDREFSRRTNILLDEIIVLTERLDRLTERVDRLTENQQITQNLATQMGALTLQLARDSETDRAEIRRIWEYLLSQSGNGQSQ